MDIVIQKISQLPYVYVLSKDRTRSKECRRSRAELKHTLQSTDDVITDQNTYIQLSTHSRLFFVNY